MSELGGITGPRPISAQELDRAIKSRTPTLPGRWETNGSVLGSIAEMERFDLPDDYFDMLPERIRGMSLEEINAAAQRVVRPAEIIWVVVGDKDTIQDGLSALDLGPVFEIDPEGNVIGQLAN